MHRNRPRWSWLIGMSVLTLFAAVLGLSGPAGAATVAVASTSPGQVAIPQGKLQGSVLADEREFRGIPFAAPPVGALRWHSPQPAAGWSGVRDATKSGPRCAQALPVIGGLTPSSEDCLTLDVYTPPTSYGKNLPVMVWFYGGAYLLGSTGGYDPSPIVQTGHVIVVTVSYRVGPFGFLSLPGANGKPGLGGNFGLQDQQAGLRWVQRNIAAFGGNAGNVTIFGESAGGNSVCNQVASPTAKGLFQKAIAESGFCAGAATGQGIAPTSKQAGFARGVAYAKTMGCTKAATMISCMRGKSLHQLLNSPTVAFSGFQITWVPTIDGTVLPRTPEAAFRGGFQNHVSMILGSNHDEGRMFIPFFYQVLKARTPTAADYREVIQQLAPGDTQAVAARYPIAKYGSPLLAMSTLTTDQMTCNVNTSVEAADAGGRTVYQYELNDVNTPLAGLDPEMPLNNFHGLDLLFLFKIQLPFVGLDAAHQALANQMIGYWARFAATGNPNGAAAPAWPTSENATGRFLTLSSAGSKVSTNFSTEHQCGFWSSIAS
jgi:para-nitrobenzyl esterase